MRALLRIALACAALLTGGWATAEPWNDPVIKGYDAVAYFTEGKAVDGTAAIASTYEGGTFWFASEENRSMFEQNPKKYAPQFGGFCALGMANGMLLDGDPEAFTVHRGKLYLNIDKKARERWRKKTDENISAAEGRWPHTYEEARKGAE